MKAVIRGFVICALFLNVRVLGLFFVGAALFELGFFTRNRATLHRRLLVLAALAGLPMELAYGTGASWASDTVLSGLEAAHFLSSVVLALGFASGIQLMVHAGRFPRLMSGFANVGRTALSNYVLQSVVLNVLFWWWGFGLWGRLSVLQCVGLAFAFYAIQIVLSTAWLSTFRMGPLEWMWRVATYGKRMPLRR
jgi:uncharacterized protein